MPSTKNECLHCGQVFDSKFSFLSRQAFETSFLAGNQEQCPNCGKRTPANKENLKFPEDKSEAGSEG